LSKKIKIRIGTVFSGVGAPEHALERLGVDYEIVFACDNGDIKLFTKKIEETLSAVRKEIQEIESKLRGNLKVEPSYKNRLCTILEGIKEKYDTLEKLRKEIENSPIYISKLDTLKKNIAYFHKNAVIRDISDIFYHLSKIKRELKREIRRDKEISENNYKKEILNSIEEIFKEKNTKMFIRKIKEIIKDILHLEEDIYILEQQLIVKNLPSYEEKKTYVDKLYKQTGKKNFVKITYLKNHNLDEKHFHQNIYLLDATQYRGKVDLYVGGSPCQSFSIVGKRGGLKDTRGSLFYEFIRVLMEVQPRFFIYENVAGVLNHDQGKTWETMKNAFYETGYYFKWYLLNAKDFGIPQNRERLFVIGFKNKKDFERFEDPKKVKLTTTMRDFLEDYVDEKYYLPPKGVKFVTNEKNLKKKYTQINGEIALCQKANQQFNWHGDFIEEFSNEEVERLSKIDKKYFLSERVKKYVFDKKFFMNNKDSEQLIDLDIARPLTATMHKMHRAGVDNYISYGKNLPIEKRKIRRLTPRECFRLMGFCDSFILPKEVSDTQLYKQAGNSMVVDVLMAIIKELIKVMKEDS